MEGQPVQDQPVVQRRRWVIPVVAIIIVLLIIAAAFLVLVVFKPKLQIELWYNSDGHYGGTEPDLAQVLQASIQASGKIQVNLKSDPWAVYKQNWANQRMPLFLLGWYPDYFDSDDYVSPFMSISGAKSLGSFYNNSQVDGLVTQEQSTTNTATRTSLFAQIQGKISDDVPYVPLFSGNAQVAYDSTVTGVVLHPVTFKWFIINKPSATELKAATTDKIIDLDPASAYDFFSIEVINQVFDTLLVYEPKQTKLIPGLATEVPTVANGGISADGKNYTYHLRSGVTFHDGTPLNSSVVARSINRAVRLNLAGSAAFLLYDVGGLGRSAATGNNTTAGAIVTPDPSTIEFHLNKPLSFFNDLMAFSVAAPVPWNYNQNGKQPNTAAIISGTGPYKLTTYTAAQLVVLDANPSYYGSGLYNDTSIPSADRVASVPIMPKVSIQILQQATSLKQSIETKAVDVAFRTLDPADLKDLQTRATALGLKVDVGASPQIRYLVFNVNLVPDVRVRRAIAYLVDRPLIDETVFKGLVEPLYSMVPSAMPYASPVFQSAYGDANVAAANSILSQLGYAVIFEKEAIARDLR